MSASWIEANILYQPPGMNQVIVGHVGQTEDAETIPMISNSGGHNHERMRAITTMTITMAIIWVGRQYRLVGEVAAITTEAANVVQ